MTTEQPAWKPSLDDLVKRCQQQGLMRIPRSHAWDTDGAFQEISDVESYQQKLNQELVFAVETLSHIVNDLQVEIDGLRRKMIDGCNQT